MATKDADRYMTLRIKTTASGKQVYAPAIPVDITHDPMTDVMVTVSEEDRMDVISNNVYGTSTDWWKIAQVNGLVNGKIYMPPGTSIIIPAP